jgi:hypothetical protein
MLDGCISDCPAEGALHTLELAFQGATICIAAGCDQSESEPTIEQGKENHGRHAMKWITMIGIGLGIVWLWSSINSSQRDIAQAQAVIESARAAQEAAKAANTAATGLSIMGSGQTLILLLLTAALVGTWALVIYLVIQRVNRSKTDQRIKRRPQSGLLLTDEQPRGTDLGMLIQLETLAALRSLRGREPGSPASTQIQIPAQVEEEDELW